MKSFCELNSMINNSSYDMGRFDYIMGRKNGCEIDDVIIKQSFIISLKRFLNESNSYNTVKIENLINNNIRNINRVKKIILDYNTIKQREYFNEKF